MRKSETSIDAIPFLPTDRIGEIFKFTEIISIPRYLYIEQVVDYLKKMSFKNSSPFYKTAQAKLLSYFENTWLYGSYPPAMWNLFIFFNKTSQLTNIIIPKKATTLNSTNLCSLLIPNVLLN